MNEQEIIEAVARHDEQIKSLKDKIAEVDAIIDRLEQSLTTLDQLLNQGKGAKWMLVKLGSLVLFIFGILASLKGAWDWIAAHVVIR